MLIFTMSVFAQSANAAVSVYAFSGGPGFGGFPDAVNPGASTGIPDGVSASIPIGGFVAFQTQDLFNTVDFSVEFTGVTGAGIVRFYVGRTNGTGGFSTLNSQFFTLSLIHI